MGRAAVEVDELARELDLVVFRLERRPESQEADALMSERKTLRRDLERLRDRLADVARSME